MKDGKWLVYFDSAKGYILGALVEARVEVNPLIEGVPAEGDTLSKDVVADKVIIVEDEVEVLKGLGYQFHFIFTIFYYFSYF